MSNTILCRPPSRRRLAIANFNGDGAPDVAVSNMAYAVNTVTILRTNRDAIFVPAALTFAAQKVARPEHLQSKQRSATLAHPFYDYFRAFYPVQMPVTLPTSPTAVSEPGDRPSLLGHGKVVGMIFDREPDGRIEADRRCIGRDSGYSPVALERSNNSRETGSRNSVLLVSSLLRQ